MRQLQTQDLLDHRSFVRGLAYSLTGESESAEDLAQEALLIGLERPPDDGGALRPWLGRVVRRLAFRRFRSDRARGDRELLVHEERLGSAAGSDAARAETRLLLAEAVDALEPIYRDVLVMRFYEDLPPRAIAARLGLPVETVRTRQKRGLERMRHKLDSRFGNREAWSLALLGLAGLPPRRVGSLGLAAAALVTATVLPAVWWALRTPAASEASAPLAVSAAIADQGPGPSAPESGARRALAEQPLDETAESAPAAGTGGVWTPLGQPAVGARVRFQWPLGDGREPYECTTGDDGRFELPPDARSAAVSAWHEDWGTAGLLTARDPMFDEGFELHLFHPWPHALGRVFDEAGEPIATATVSLAVASEVGRTIAPVRWGVLLPDPFGVAADGSFRVPSVPLGTYWIRVEAPGFAPAAQVWTPVQDNELFEFTLARGFTLEGRLSLRGGRPAAGATVEVEFASALDPRSVSADAQGRFELAHLPRAPFVVRAAWSDDASGWMAREELSACTLERLVWNAELAPGGAIRGWALDADDEVPAGCMVRAVAGRRARELELDEFGGFLLTGWDEPYARLELRDRARRLRALATWTAGMPEIELREQPGRLVGEVHMHDQRLADRVLLLLRHTDTDDELEATYDIELGRLDTGGLVAGDWQLLRWLPGRRTDEIARFSVRAGETTDFGTLEVPALARLTVDVGREPGGHVRLLRRLVDGSAAPESERRVSQADADGLLAFEVQPDAYEVRIGGIRAAARSYTVVLEPGVHELLIPEERELVECVLRVLRPSAGAEGGLLDLRVVDPVIGVDVLLQRRPMRPSSPRQVEFEVALPPGRWLLRASSPEGRVERSFHTDALDDVVFELRVD